MGNYRRGASHEMSSSLHELDLFFFIFSSSSISDLMERLVPSSTKQCFGISLRSNGVFIKLVCAFMLATYANDCFDLIDLLP